MCSPGYIITVVGELRTYDDGMRAYIQPSSVRASLSPSAPLSQHIEMLTRHRTVSDGAQGIYLRNAAEVCRFSWLSPRQR